MGRFAMSETVFLEVDGRIQNPAVATAIVVWTLLCVIVGFLAGRGAKPKSVIVAAFLLTAATFVAPRIIASWWYSLGARAMVFTNFWGFPGLAWLAPVAGAVAFTVSYLRRRPNSASV